MSDEDTALNIICDARLAAGEEPVPVTLDELRQRGSTGEAVRAAHARGDGGMKALAKQFGISPGTVRYHLRGGHSYKSQRKRRLKFERLADAVGAAIGAPEAERQDATLRLMALLDEAGLTVVPKVPTTGMIYASLAAMRHFEPLEGDRFDIQWGKHVVRYMAMVERMRAAWNPSGQPISVREAAERAAKRLAASMAELSAEMAASVGGDEDGTSE